MQNLTTKIDNSSVISFERWKKKVQMESQQKDHEMYLSVLNFNQIISEATDTLSKLKTDSFDHNLMIRSKLLLQEFNRRIDSLSGEFSNSLTSIRAKVDKKIKELDTKILK